MRIRALNVLEVNQYLKQMMGRDPILNRIAVVGELSGLKLHTSGHAYFALKDGDAKLNCVWFNAEQDPITKTLRDGMQLVCEGAVTLYEKEGRCQLAVKKVSVSGIGDLAQQFEAMKRKLSDLGYFDQARKRTIPFLPKKVAFVTSPTGAVIRDLLTVSGRRNPNIEVVLVPTAVQGVNAEIQVAKAIETINELKLAEVIIIARGGGAIEELWTFNTEIVAEAIFKSNIPVISAVGHETDFTIADFVADLRAATPSEAAELAFPDLLGLQTYVNGLKNQMTYSMNKQLNDVKNMLLIHNPNREYGKIMSVIKNHRQFMLTYQKSMQQSIEHSLTSQRSELLHYGEMLNSLSPLAVLRRGYTLTVNQSGKAISSVSQVHVGESVQIQAEDGTLLATVSDIQPKEGDNTNG